MVSILKNKPACSHPSHDATSCLSGLEFKETRPMSPLSLHQLDGSTIEVVLDVGGVSRSVQGKGQFDAADPDLGRVLRVLVVDAPGDFELLIPESGWDGACESSSLPGCKFKLRLESSLPC